MKSRVTIAAAGLVLAILGGVAPSTSLLSSQSFALHIAPQSTRDSLVAPNRTQTRHHILSAVGVSGQATAQNSASPTFTVGRRLRYRVRRGDTLSSIGRRFHVPWRRLAEWNHLRQPRRLRAGQMLIVANPHRPPKPAHHSTHHVPVRYRVKRGQSLSAIARQFHTSWTHLAHLNHLAHPSRIRAGQLLWISGKHAPRHRASIRSAGYHPPVRSLGRAIVATAMRYRGVPYVWGGTSPKGFDCSGLVQYVYAQHHIHIPRTTWTQFRVIRRVPRWRLKPGDLVFFGNRATGATHVGIYIGADRSRGFRQAFIAAPAPGQRVNVQNLDSWYWTRRYLGGGPVRT